MNMGLFNHSTLYLLCVIEDMQLCHEMTSFPTNHCRGAILGGKSLVSEREVEP